MNSKQFQWLLGVLAVACACSSCQRNAPQPLAKTATLEMFLVVPNGTAGSRVIADSTGAQVFLANPPVVATSDIATVERAGESKDSAALIVKLTPPGATKLQTATTPPGGKQLAIVVNGTLLSVSTVMSTLSDSFRIEGGTLPKEREDVYLALTKE